MTPETALKHHPMTEVWPFWKSIPRFDREYSFADLCEAFGALLRTRDEETGWIQEVFATSSFHFARTGTQSLYLILKLLQLKPKSRVGIPLYCCAAVFEAIVAAGHVPVFLDIDLDTYGFDPEFLRKKRDQLDALVIVHVFGYPADFRIVRSALEGREIPIIEDCAHSLFSEYEHTMTGGCADAAFLTFGMHKPAAVGGGAIILVNNPDLALAAKRELSGLGAESRYSEFRHSLLCWARSVSYHRAAYGALLASPIGHGRDNGRWTPRENGTSVLDQQFTPGHIRAVDRVLVARRVQEFGQKMPALSKNTQQLREALREAPLAFPAEPSYGKWNHFLVPVRFPSKMKRESGRRFLLRRRVDTSPLFQNCARNALRFGYAGDCPKAQFVADTICTVPNHAWLSGQEIAYVGESLRLSAEQL